MRISSDKNSPDYTPRRAFVYLDGKKVERCFSADSDAGEVVCAVVDEKGRLKIIEADGDYAVAKETIRGNVEIVFVT
jgi:hypothetical protein